MILTLLAAAWAVAASAEAVGGNGAPAPQEEAGRKALAPREEAGHVATALRGQAGHAAPAAHAEAGRQSAESQAEAGHRTGALQEEAGHEARSSKAEADHRAAAPQSEAGQGKAGHGAPASQAEAGHRAAAPQAETDQGKAGHRAAAPHAEADHEAPPEKAHHGVPVPREAAGHEAAQGKPAEEGYLRYIPRPYRKYACRYVPGDYQRYMHYQKDGEYQVWPRHQSAASDIARQYMDKDYEAEWPRFAREGMRQQSAPARAEDSTTEEELEAWRDGQRDEIREWVPRMFQDAALASLQREFEANKARIAAAANRTHAAAANRTENREAAGAAAPNATGHKGAAPEQLAAESGDMHCVPGAFHGPARWQRNYAPGDYQLYMAYQKFLNDEAWPDHRESLASLSASARGGHVQHFKIAPARVEDCKTREELASWRNAERKEIRKWVPRAFRDNARAWLQHEFQLSKARIIAAGSKRHGEPETWLEQPGYAQYVPKAYRNNTCCYRNYVPGKYQQYMRYQRYAEYQAWPHLRSGYSDIARQYMDKDYAAEWPRFAREGMRHQSAPARAEDCTTEEELTAWRDAQRHEIREWVPRMFQDSARDTLECECQANRARIAAAAHNASHAALAASQRADGRMHTSPELLTAEPSYMRYVPTAYGSSAGPYQRYVPGDYQHYMRYQQFMDYDAWPYRSCSAAPPQRHPQGALGRAEEIHTAAALRAWSEDQRAAIREWVPQAAQDSALAMLRGEVEAQRAWLDTWAPPQAAEASAGGATDPAPLERMATVAQPHGLGGVSLVAAALATLAVASAAFVRSRSRQRAGAFQAPLLDA